MYDPLGILNETPKPKKGQQDPLGILVKKKESGTIPSNAGGQAGVSSGPLEDDNTPDQYGRTGWMKTLPPPMKVGESEDPLGEALSSAQEKLTQSRFEPTLKRFQQAKEAHKEIKSISNAFQGSGSSAKPFLDKTIGDDSDKYSPEELKQKVVGNITGKKALEAVNDLRRVSDALNSTKELSEAANKYAGASGDVSKVTEGENLQRLLNNTNVMERAKANSEFGKKYQQAKDNWYKNYPEAANKEVASEIGQEIEDNGDASWFYNNPGTDKADAAVERLIKKGKWDDQKDAFYKEHIRPDLRTLKTFWSGSPIPTADLINDSSRGIKEGGDFLLKGGLDMSRLMQGGYLADLPVNEQERLLAEKMKEQREAMPEVVAKGLKKYSSAGLHFVGFAAPMILGELAGVPAYATAIPQFEGVNSVRAYELYKDDEAKRQLYTILTTTADAAMMAHLPVGEASQTVRKLLDKDIRGTIDDFAAKKLTSEEAKDAVYGKLNDVLESFGVNTTQGGAALTANQFAHNGIDAAFGQRDFNVAKEAKNILESLPENMANISLLAGIGAAGKLLSPKAKEKVSEEATKEEQIEQPIAETKPEESEFDTFKNHILDVVGDVKDNSFAFRITTGLDQKGIEQAVRNIKEGKDTKAAQTLLASIKEMHDDGYVYLNTAAGGKSQSIQIPIKEYMAEVNKPLKIEDLEELNTILGEDAFNSNFDNAYEYETKRPTENTETSTTTAEATGKNIEETSGGKGASSTKEEIPIPGVGQPPVEPPKETVSHVYFERPKTELSFRGLQNVANEFGYEDVRPRDRVSDLQTKTKARAIADEWASKGEYQKNIDDLLFKIQEGKAIPTDDLRLVLQEYLANEVQKLRDIKDKNSPEFNQQLDKVGYIKATGQKARSLAGAALRLPENGGSYVRPIEDYGDAMIAKMEANNVDQLTEAQKAEVDTRVKDYEQKLNDANDKITLLEQKMSEMEAQKEVARAVAKRKQSGVKKTSEDYKKERALYIEELKAAKEEHKQWLKDQGIHQQGISGITLTPKMVKAIGKLVGSYAEEVGNNLAEITKKVYHEVKDYFEGITEKDIHDIIAGVYNPKKETRSELQTTLNDIHEEARLINKLEAIEKGKPVSERAKVERNQKIKDLREKIKSIKQGEEYKLSEIRDRNLKRAKEIQERIAKGDFEVKKPQSVFANAELKKKYPEKYNAALDAIRAKEDAVHDFDLALLKDQERRQNTVQKSARYMKLVVGTTKALKAGIDFSGTFVQNFITMLAHPITGSKAFVEAMRQAASEKRFNRYLSELHGNVEAMELLKAGEVSITEPSSLSSLTKEEAFSNNLLDKTFKIFGKEVNIGKYLTKPFERHYTAFGNIMRRELYLRVAEKWVEKGVTPENNPKLFKDLGSLYNTETGRGNLHKQIERANELITAVHWSPKLTASRLNLLGISDVGLPIVGGKGFYAGLSPKVRAMAIADLSKAIGASATLLSVAALAGLPVDLNPTSPTFGTIQLGDKRINVFDGFAKYVRTIAQAATGKKIKDGESVKAERGETVFKFFRSSTTPAAGVGLDVLTGKDYNKKPITLGGEIKNLAAPIAVEGLVKEVKRDGALGVAVGLGQALGLAITDERDYKNEPKSPKTKNTKFNKKSKEYPKN